MTRKYLTPIQKVFLFALFSNENMFYQERGLTYLKQIIKACDNINSGPRVKGILSFLDYESYKKTVLKYGNSNAVFYDNLNEPIFSATLSSEDMDNYIFNVIDNITKNVLNENSKVIFLTLNNTASACFEYTKSFYDYESWHIFYNTISNGLKYHSNIIKRETLINKWCN